MKRGRIAAALMTIMMLATHCLYGQYIEPEEYAPTFRARFFSAGVSFLNFEPRSGNPVPDSLAISFTKVMPMLSYSQDPVELVFGYTRYSSGGSTRTAIVLSTTVATEIPLGGRRGGGFAVPLCVVGDFTKAESGGAERDHFNFASLGAGAGVRVRIGSGALSGTASLLGVVQFTFEGYGTRNGSSSAVIGNATLFWRTAPVFDGLVFGYRFRYQSWSISDSRFDYKAILHGPYIGAIF
jgi:hypothetical protein